MHAAKYDPTADDTGVNNYFVHAQVRYISNSAQLNKFDDDVYEAVLVSSSEDFFDWVDSNNTNFANGARAGLEATCINCISR